MDRVRGPRDVFPLRYAVSGGTLQVDLAFDISSDGAFTVEILTESSLPQPRPVRLGRFGGHFPPSVLNTLTEWAYTLDASTAMAPEELPFGTVSRSLTRGEADTVFVNDVPQHLDEQLADAAEHALGQPLAAIEVAARENQLVITGIADQPYPVLLFARDIPGYWVRVWRNGPDGPAYLPYETVVQLAETGRIPEGPAALKSGESITLPLPAAAEGSDAGGGFTFWRTGAGLERRILAGSW